jgi:glucokinase
MVEDTYPRLVADVGGTNARFAWIAAPDAPPAQIATYHCDDHASLTRAVRHYLAEHALPGPRWAAIGIATPVTGDAVRMTNHPWAFSIEQVRKDLGLERLAVVNDFTALALSLPVLEPADLLRVGGGEPALGAPLALLGPGTGLGVSGLLFARGGQAAVPISGEGGHVTLAAADDLEAQVIELLRRRFGHVSAERALSGPGLSNLHEALARIRGESRPAMSAAQITAAAPSDAHCAAVVDLFCALLGNVAGNLALTLGARGGVYVGGGIVPRIAEQLARSRFRERFEAKGRFRDYLAAIPTWLLVAEDSPALVGAARALEQL